MADAAANVENWTVKRLLDWTRDYLTRQQVDSPRLCSEILLAHAMGCERLMLFTRYDETPDEAVRCSFREAVKAAGAGKPIAYITGAKEFFSLPFEVTPDVLIPRPETEILVERTIRLARDVGWPQPRILDVGAGSGCIAISLAKHLPDAGICASDLSTAALDVARRNAERHAVTGRIQFAAGDLFAPWTAGAAPFQVIVSNPPYIPDGAAGDLPRAVRDFEPRAALIGGDDGLSVIRRLIAEAPALLAPDGHLLFEVMFDQSSRVLELADRAVWPIIDTYRDLGGHPRVIHLRRAAARDASAA